MTYRIRKLLALLLCLALCLSLAPTAWAEEGEVLIESPESTEEAETPLPETPAGEPKAWKWDHLTRLNPLYADLLEESELFPPQEDSEEKLTRILAALEAPEGEEMLDAQDGESLDDIIYTSLGSAAIDLREAMKERKSSLTLAFYDNAVESWGGFNPVVDALFETAFLHDRTDPKGGDSLLFQYAAYDVSGAGDGYYYAFDFQLSYFSDADQELTLDQEVKTIIEQLKLSGLSDYQKIEKIYDYLCNTVSYDYEHLEDPAYLLKATAYAALVNHRAVCQGYAVAFYRLCLESGVEARVVDCKRMDHAWNIARPEQGDYYSLDATWDSSYAHSYFLRGSSWWLANHENYGYTSLGDQFADEAFAASHPMDTEDYRPSAPINPPDPASGIAIDSAHFPDSNFRAYVQGSFDPDWDHVLSKQEIDAVTSIDVTGWGIASLIGVENFPRLKKLLCDKNKLTALNLSGNPALLELACRENSLTSLDLSVCPQLISFYGSQNELESLNVRGCSRLAILVAWKNELTELELSGLSALEILGVDSNHLQSLDCSDCPNLLELYCFANELTELNVSTCPFLYYLECEQNALTQLNLSRNPVLRFLSCGENNLSRLNVSGNPKLGFLAATDMPLDSLDISACPSLLEAYTNNVYEGENEDYDVYLGTEPVFEDREGACTLIVDKGLPIQTEPAPEPSAAYSYSLSLADSIDINFTVKDLAEGTKPEDYRVVYTFCGETVEAPLTSMTSNNFVIANTAAKEMTEKATVEVWYKDRLLKTGTYSVRSYCEAMLQIKSSPKLTDLLISCLDYGSYAQKYFNYRTDDLANRGTDYGDVPGVVIPEATNVKEGSCTGIVSPNYSLMLQSKTTFQVSFNHASGAKLGDYTFTVNGTAVTPTDTGSKFVIDLNGIAAKNLGDRVVVTVTHKDGSRFRFESAPVNYMYAARGTAVGNTMKALYAYHQAAVNYFA